jgi:hypothetical protein
LASAANVTDYPERYVAFIDVLNFRGIIEAVNRGERTVEAVRSLLHAIHQPGRPEPYAEQEADFKAQSISDAVALSSAYTPQGLDHIFYTVSVLALGLLEAGIFIRGAITKGRLYHDETTVFGEGLIRAYQFESQVARYPPVIISRDVFQDVEQFKQRVPWKTFFRNSVQQAEDGPMYLNIFSQLDAERARSSGMRMQIQQEFDASIDDPIVFEKLQWFAKYWNEIVVKGMPDVQPIYGPGAWYKSPSP